MFGETKAFSGFTVDDAEKARAFYGDVLGIRTETLEMGEGMFTLALDGGARPTFVYAKSDHAPAEYTILNFPVEDVDAAVDALVAKGVAFERYEGFDQDEKGIARSPGNTIAWFKDPAGNVLAVLSGD